MTALAANYAVTNSDCRELDGGWEPDGDELAAKMTPLFLDDHRALRFMPVSDGLGRGLPRKPNRNLIAQGFR